jgi:hypothetical protein
MPPSMINSAPTVNADSSEARNTTALAISDGAPPYWEPSIEPVSVGPD